MADHTHNGRGKQELPPQAFHNPPMVFSPQHVQPDQLDTVTPQIDVAPTILGLLGQSYRCRFFGQDILTEGQTNPRAFLANDQTFDLFRDGWVVEPKSPRRDRVVNVDPGVADRDPQALLTDAVTHYQAASVALHRG